jgi:hypothetical protein
LICAQNQMTSAFFWQFVWRTIKNQLRPRRTKLIFCVDICFSLSEHPICRSACTSYSAAHKQQYFRYI